MSLVKRIDRQPFTLDEFFNTDWFGGTSSVNRIGLNTPAVNVQETEDAFHIELAAPGLTKEDFNIELDNDTLSISSEIKDESNEENDQYTRREFSYQTFRRSFNLPDTINSAEVNATYENGVLKINLAKKEEAKIQPKRLIEIQ